MVGVKQLVLYPVDLFRFNTVAVGDERFDFYVIILLDIKVYKRLLQLFMHQGHYLDVYALRGRQVYKYLLGPSGRSFVSCPKTMNIV